MSRQREWQKKMAKAGRCMMCGKHGDTLCERHRLARLIQNRNRYRLKHGIALDAPRWTRGTGK